MSEFKKYVDQAISYINKKSDRIKNDIYYQNRLIDFATKSYIKDPVNFDKIYDHVSKDIIKDEHRANHYGIPIGTFRGYRLYKRKDHNTIEGRIKKRIKNYVRTLELRV